MINIRDGELADMLPIQFTRQPQILALSYALKQAYMALLTYQERLLIYADIDAARENVLDYLAVEFATWGYRNELPIEKKREIIKKAFEIALMNGTWYALQSMLSAAFENTEAAEWFNYNGTPGHYRLRMDTESGYDLDTLLKSIEMKKRKSAHLESLGLVMKQDLRTGVSVYSKQTIHKTMSSHEMTMEITEQPQDCVCEIGAYGTFTVTATGVTSYQWYVKGQGGTWKKSAANGNTTPTLRNMLTALGYTYSYFCLMTDEYGNELATDVVKYINPNAEQEEE